MSTYSSNLKIELIATGDQSGVWGVTTNDNFSNVFEQSIVGRVTVSFSNADVTLTATNTVASQDYRNVYLNCTGTNAASRNLIVPTLNKNYIVENNTTGGFSIVVKTSAGTGITIPNGFKCAVYVNGTDVVQNDNYFPVATVGTLTLTSLTAGSITDSGLTSGRVTYAGTAGLLQDSANLTFNGTTLTANTIGAYTLSGTIAGGGNQLNNIIIGTTTPLAGSFTTINASTSITNAGLTSGRVTFAGASGLLSDNANFVYDSSERLIVGASSAAIGNRMEVVSNTGSQAIGIRGRVSDGAGVISWHPNASATEYARIQSDSNSALMFGTGSSGTERMRITSAGNVGIGTSSPNNNLEVYSTSNPSIALTSTSASLYSYFGMTSGTVGAQLYTFGQSYSAVYPAGSTALANDTYGLILNASNASGILRFQTNATERMRIDSSGNLLLGTTSATANFKFVTSLSADTTAGIMIENTSNTTSATAVMRYKNSGSTFAYTGLGSPTRDVYAGLGPNVLAMYTGDTAGISFTVDAAGPIKFVTSATERMRIDSSGNLLVGTTSVVLSGKLTTSFTGNTINGATFDDTGNGNGAGFIIFSESGTAIGNISRVSTTSAVAYNTTSDQRLKSNVTDSESVIDKLMQVKVRQYDWTQGEVHQDYGFIAQELEPVLSGIVTKGKTDEDMWQLDYAKLTPHLVKAIQEQQALIELLTTRLTNLENK